MTSRLLAAALAISLGSLAVRAQDHPFKDVKPNDFATYKMKVTVGPLNLEGTTTQIVTEKTDKEAKVRVTANFGGMETPPQEQTIDLTKAYDPTRIGTLPPGAKVEVKKLKSGEEVVKAGKDKEGKDREFKCTWTTYQIDAEASGQKITGEVKVWESPQVKMGLVKMEMTGKVTSTTDAANVVDTRMNLEIQEFGTKMP